MIFIFINFAFTPFKDILDDLLNVKVDWRFFCDTVPIDIYWREYVDDEKYFNYSTCDRGRWTCEEDRCSSSCEIVGLNHVATFDGNRYSFAPDSCSYTLVEVKTRDPPKISNL